MKNTFVAAIAAFFMAGAVSAAEVTGEVEVTVDGDAVATTELTLGFDAGEGVATGSITLDENGIDGYAIGTTLSGVSLSYGDQDDIMIGGGLNVVGGTTIADPASADTSLILGVGDADVLIGFGADITAVDNVQVGYTLGVVSATVDYNLNTEDFTIVGAGSYSLAGIDGGLTVSYTDTVAYEVSTGLMGATVYVNGDQDDMLQNLGAGYETEVGGLNVFAEAEYNLDTKEVTPAFGVSFAF